METKDEALQAKVKEGVLSNQQMHNERPHNAKNAQMMIIIKRNKSIYSNSIVNHRTA